jgi:hypothetical protein
MLRQREESSGFFHGMNANVTVPSDDPHSLLLTAQLLPAWQPPALWAAAALSLLSLCGQCVRLGSDPDDECVRQGHRLALLGWNESITPSRVPEMPSEYLRRCRTPAWIHRYTSESKSYNDLELDDD